MTLHPPSSRSLLWWALGLALLTTVTRLPALLHPRAIDDEEVYSVVATEIVDGGLPYVNAVERKPPLLFWVYALVFEVGGKYDWVALHGAAVLWTLLTLAGLYALGASLFDPVVGLVAALLYSVFQPWGTWKNLAFNGELLMNLPIVWAYWLGFRRSGSSLRPELLLSGALLGAGFLLKQPAAIAAVPLGLYLLSPGYRAGRGLALRDSLLHAGLLTLGFFGMLGGVALLLAHQGILAEAYYWTIRDHDIPYIFWHRGLLHTVAFAAACGPLVVGAAWSLGKGRVVWASRRPEFLALVGLLLASAVGTAASGRFYPHYFIQLVPPLAALAAPWLVLLWRSPEKRGIARISQVWIGASALVFLGFSWRALRAVPEPTEAGSYIRAHSAPGERIFVWGQAAVIYLDAERRPASRYIATFPLTGYIFGAPLPGVNTDSRILPGSWETLGRELAAHPPGFIVDAEAARPESQYPAARYPLLAGLLASDYREVHRAREGIVYQRIVAAVVP